MFIALLLYPIFGPCPKANNAVCRQPKQLQSGNRKRRSCDQILSLQTWQEGREHRNPFRRSQVTANAHSWFIVCGNWQRRVVAMQHVRRITGVIYLAFVFQIQTDSHFLVCCCSAYISLSLALRGSYRPLDQRVLLPSKWVVFCQPISFALAQHLLDNLFQEWDIDKNELPNTCLVKAKLIGWRKHLFIWNKEGLFALKAFQLPYPIPCHISRCLHYREIKKSWSPHLSRH